MYVCRLIILFDLILKKIWRDIFRTIVLLLNKALYSKEVIISVVKLVIWLAGSGWIRSCWVRALNEGDIP